MCLETVFDSKPAPPATGQSSTSTVSYDYDSEEHSLEENERKIEFFVLELFCNTMFTVEIIFRFIASPNKFAFIRSFPNVLDVVAVLPFWTNLVVSHLNAVALTELRQLEKMERMLANQTAMQQNYTGTRRQ